MPRFACTLTANNVAGPFFVTVTAPGTNRLTYKLVNMAASQAPVPNVVGLTQQNATTALTGSGLKTGKVTTKADKTPAGTVISQNPATGDVVKSGSSVDLTVSSGPGK